jgi:hypothetical protein
MLYAKIRNQKVHVFPYSIAQLKADNPNVSFAKNMTAEAMEAFGCFEVRPLSTPTESRLTHSVQHSETPVLDGGKWKVDYYAVPKPHEQASQNLRAERDMRLSSSDWMALSDSTMTPAWAAYRQALRDVTSQESFPYDVIWPTEPV